MTLWTGAVDFSVGKIQLVLFDRSNNTGAIDVMGLFLRKNHFKMFKFTIQPCMEYYCHIWTGAPSCYLEMLDKLQKRTCRTVGPSLAASL